MFNSVNLSICACNAQSIKMLSNKQLKQHIEISLDEFRSDDNHLLNRFCGRGSIFIKLTLNKKTNMINISLTKDSSVAILSLLNSSLKKLQKDKELINTLKGSGKVVLMPLIYNFEADCDLSLKSTEIEAHKSMLSYVFAMGNLYTTILNMLNFDDGKVESLNCILLSPCIIGSTN